MMLTPNQTARNAEHARIAQRARQRQRRNAPRLGVAARNDRKLPRTKAKRIAAAIVPDTEAEAPIIGAIACSWVTRCASAPAAAVTAMKRKNLKGPKRRATACRTAAATALLKPR